MRRTVVFLAWNRDVATPGHDERFATTGSGLDVRTPNAEDDLGAGRGDHALSGLDARDFLGMAEHVWVATWASCTACVSTELEVRVAWKMSSRTHGVRS